MGRVSFHMPRRDVAAPSSEPRRAPAARSWKTGETYQRMTAANIPAAGIRTSSRRKRALLLRSPMRDPATVMPATVASHPLRDWVMYITGNMTSML